MSEYWQAVWTTLLQLAPWLLLGAAIAGLMHGLLPPDFIKRHLGGRGGVLKAVMLGIPMPLCSCGVIPTGLGLKKQGATDGATVGFLISTPQTGVDSALVSASFLGWPFALFKIGAAAATGLVGGWLTNALTPQSSAPSPTQDKLAPGPHNNPSPTPHANRSWRAMVAHATEMLQTIWGWLVFGVLLSAAIEHFLPAGFFEGTTAYGAAVAMMVTLAISLPLYICTTASVPIAAALVAGGMPTGAALVFLMAGPATNIATLGAVNRTLGTRNTIIYLLTIVAGSVGLGLTFDFLLQGAAAGAADPHAHHDMHGAWWEVGSALVLLGLLAWFALGDLRGWWAARQVAAAKDRAIEVGVDGMTCGGCSSRLQKVLSRIDGVENAAVTLDDGGRATVQGDVSRGIIEEHIRNAGFTPRPT